MAEDYFEYDYGYDTVGMEADTLDPNFQHPDQVNQTIHVSQHQQQPEPPFQGTPDSEQEMEWVKPNEKIELITGAPESPTLQATATPWAPSQAVLAVVAAKESTNKTESVNSSDGTDTDDDALVLGATNSDEGEFFPTDSINSNNNQNQNGVIDTLPASVPTTLTGNSLGMDLDIDLDLDIKLNLGGASGSHTDLPSVAGRTESVTGKNISDGIDAEDHDVVSRFQDCDDNQGTVALSVS